MLTAIPFEQVVDLDGQLAELVALRDEGKIVAVDASPDWLACYLPATPCLLIPGTTNISHRNDDVAAGNVSRLL